MRLSPFSLRRIVFVAVFSAAAFLFLERLPAPTASPGADRPTPVLTEKALTHITIGDKTGGGHLAGRGIPCKTEFPKSWTVEKIAETLPRLAANDNLDWRKSRRNPYISTEIQAEGITLRLVVDPRRDEIVTAYPVSLPRNPCPAMANDP